ncbi:MAG: YdcF family protein [Microcystaceae cyanobacterium]
MSYPKKSYRNLSRPSKWRKVRRKSMIVFLTFIFLLTSKIVWNLLIILPENSQKPVDAILVLGGSIQRELYVGKIATQYPKIPIIISGGSDAPCVFQIFDYYQAPMENVWLESCATSTFGNFVFTTSLLKEKQVHKVLVITSPTHIPRAKYLAYIHLGTQGMGIKMKVIKQRGVPGNWESNFKTALDVTRSILWVFAAQIIHPSCSNMLNLAQMNWSVWEQQKYGCEKQNKIKLKQNR